MVLVLHLVFLQCCGEPGDGGCLPRLNCKVMKVSFGIYGTVHSTHACSATSRSSLLTVV
jgi:hypothetical protein